MNNKIKKILRIVIIFLALIEFIDKFIGVIYPKIDYFYYEENTQDINAVHGNFADKTYIL